LFILKGAHRVAAQLLIGLVLLALGIAVAHAPAATLVGAVLVGWGLYGAVTGRRSGRQV
jgi:hypothetical protein